MEIRFLFHQHVHLLIRPSVSALVMGFFPSGVALQNQADGQRAPPILLLPFLSHESQQHTGNTGDWYQKQARVLTSVVSAVWCKLALGVALAYGFSVLAVSFLWGLVFLCSC